MIESIGRSLTQTQTQTHRIEQGYTWIAESFQMAPCLDSPVDSLADAIHDEMHRDLQTLVNLWVRWLCH